MHSVVVVLGPNPRLLPGGSVHPTDENPFHTVAIPQHPQRCQLVRDMLECVVAEGIQPTVVAGAKRSRCAMPSPLPVCIVNEFTVPATPAHLGLFHEPNYIRIVQRCHPVRPLSGMCALSTLVAPISIDECIEGTGVGRGVTYEDLVDAGLADESLCDSRSHRSGEDEASEEDYSGISLIPKVSLGVSVGAGEMASCHPFACMRDASTNVVSGALTAIDHLFGSGSVSVAMYPFGGRHHARSERASGFCVFNDVVIAVEDIKRRLVADGVAAPKVLVVDVDAHHGDGTEVAFAQDPNVTTFSCHALGVGYFPGQGASSSTGAINVPFPVGSGDAEVVPLVADRLREAFEGQWHCCVLVAGTDAIRGDPLGGLNLSISGFRALTLCVMRSCLLAKSKLLVLGSGGYVDVTASRCWAALLLDATREYSSSATPLPLRGQEVSSLPSLPLDVPASLEFFSHYGPSFTMDSVPTSRHPPPLP